MNLAERDVRAVELMDDADCDPVALERTYAYFRFVNAVVAGWKQVYSMVVRPLVRGGAPLTLLDIGFGGGDLSRALSRWSARDGNRLRITAIDPDERALRFASAGRPVPGLEFRQAISSDLVADGRSFDFVVSNHLLHHLTDHEFDSLLADSAALTRVRAVHSDIARSCAAYLAFSIGTFPFFRGSYIRTDGLTSIRRSYTAAELRGVVRRNVISPGWRLMTQFPARNLLVFDRPGAHA